MPRNTCSAYNNNNKKKEKKEIKGVTKIHREPKWCGRESSKVALSLSLLGSGLPKKKSRGMKPKKTQHTHWCAVCRALPLNGDAVSIMTSMYSAERERETSVCENESGNSG
jgi:hypothetical protein